jgi:hypothetical protein
MLKIEPCYFPIPYYGIKILIFLQRGQCQQINSQSILNPMSESTLWEGKKCCHIVLFSKGVHFWTSTVVILEHIFPNVLYNMLDHNTKFNRKENTFFQLILCDSKTYLWQKNVRQCVLKNVIILKKKWLKWF